MYGGDTDFDTYDQRFLRQMETVVYGHPGSPYRRLLAAAGCALADVTVGVIISLTGPGASLGVHYRNTINMLPKTVAGEPVRYIVIDDASDTTAAVRAARKLVSEDQADIIMGSSSVPASLAIAEVAAETKTPQVALSPLTLPADKGIWSFVVPQSIPLMIAGVVKHMQARGVKSVAYIGFNDPWGEGIYKALLALAGPADLKVLTNERYARTDTSVEAQVLKMLSASPDAVLIGGTGTPGALPAIALAVPKGGLARLGVGLPGHRPWRRSSGLTGSRASPFSSLHHFSSGGFIVRKPR